jgi:diacylglycerol kinase (ATP)
MRRVLFFLNPLLMERRNRRTIVEQIAARLRSSGCTVDMQDTLSAHSAGEQAQDAVAAGYDTIFVCGGDGTIFQVIQGIAGSDVALGIIPFGTGNVLAQNLRLPHDPAAAAELQFHCDTVSIPLGKITCKTPGHVKDKNWYFAIAAGIGVHAALMNLAPTGNGKRVGGRAAYYFGGINLLLRHPIEPFEVELQTVDGCTRSLRASEMIAVRVGEINRWRPGGKMLEPVLRLATVPETSRLGLVHASFHALATRKTQGTSRLPYPSYDDVTKITCRPVADYEYQTPLLVEADGEVIGMKQATVSIAQRRLRMLWPQTAPKTAPRS